MDIEVKEQQFKEASKRIAEVKEEVQRFIVGQGDIVEAVLWTILAGGHTLLEGLPGVGKTMLVRSLSEVMDLSFSRIQFTPDLMPTDITGTMVMKQARDDQHPFVFHEGPLFHHLVLADEINRSTPKTQSALLEAMAERTVTVVGETMTLEKPFFVLATQNPIDLEGTYPLPEAQVDRFMSKLLVSYPSKQELKQIIKRTTGTDAVFLEKKLSHTELLSIQALVKEIIVTEEMIDFAIDLIDATHPSGDDTTLGIKQFVEYGSGPRGLQNIILMAKARALTLGRYHVSTGDIKKVAPLVLRHRIILNFEGEAMNVKTDDLIHELIDFVQKGVQR
ncbi:AAA family ATPase [Bacillus sp. AFS015802]|uniref:AAA family ATPase n=1 Tax=Bacillus sp. AFS015802 TaxID=2033486 RepID=UPI000BF7E416|nr:MoxR family ATPase [Bacillus sp. AFS015802]PFA68870.1 AAA family ATPase [Bacillus sp. AFS015802]